MTCMVPTWKQFTRDTFTQSSLWPLIRSDTGVRWNHKKQGCTQDLPWVVTAPGLHPFSKVYPCTGHSLLLGAEIVFSSQILRAFQGLKGFVLEFLMAKNTALHMNRDFVTD